MKATLRNGPWKTVFQGVFEKHDLEIMSNPDEVMLVAIYDKEGPEQVGVVLQSFGIYSVVGEAETFVESLQREAIILSRHDGKHTVQFLAIASKPAYAKLKGDEAAKEVDAQLKALAEAGKKVKGVSKSFGVQLTSLGECSSSAKQAFFSQPAIIPMLAREPERIEAEEEEKQLETGAEGAAIVLGMTKDGKQVKEPVKLFEKALVTNGTLGQRVHFIQIVVESYLLANVPVIIFDEADNFSGLSQPTKNLAELQSQGVPIEPIGFPAKNFEPGKNIKANTNVLDPSALLKMFGCDDKEASEILAKAMAKGPVKSLDELVRNLDSLEGPKAENQFLKRRVERIVKLIGLIYPEFFNGETDLEELAKGWFKKIGKASIVKTNSLDPRALTILLASISKELLGRFAKEGETGKPRLLLVIPDAGTLFSIRESLMLKELVKSLAEMKRFGVSVIVGAEKATDLSEEMRQILNTKASVIKKDDVAIDLPNSKNYRVLVRPTLSQSKEFP